MTNRIDNNFSYHPLGPITKAIMPSHDLIKIEKLFSTQHFRIDVCIIHPRRDEKISFYERLVSYPLYQLSADSSSLLLVIDFNMKSYKWML